MQSDDTFEAGWLEALGQFRKQGLRLADVNPISALADVICEQLYSGEINASDVGKVLDRQGGELWVQRGAVLRSQTGLTDQTDAQKFDLPDLSGRDITRPLYRTVFTAHPVFAMRDEASRALCRQAETGVETMPEDAFMPRAGVTLLDEHEEAMLAVENARGAVCRINAEILRQRQTTHSDSWRDELPEMLGVSTWVGYDLDGRSDITWSDSFGLRLKEKARALKGYVAALAQFDIAGPKSGALETIRTALADELANTEAEVLDFTRIKLEGDDFTAVVNRLTRRKDKLVSSKALAKQLHQIAKAIADEDAARGLMVVAADVATHGFGMGEVHLRINAAQLRNAMRVVDGRSTTISDGVNSPRLLMERLARRIQNEPAWDINFKNIAEEEATARRQLMVAAQFLKHIDTDQPIRLLIAECEKPLTVMSALYLAHKLDIADRLDISPLFETNFGLEHGEKIIDQLLQQPVFVDYVRRRGRLAIQTGFSDAGRFVGQLAANMAIERLQIKIAGSLKSRVQDNLDLLVFNTHGESLGRGSTQASMLERQHYLMTPFVRDYASGLGVRLYHQSSFQGGDGFRLFGTPQLALATMRGLFEAELSPPPPSCKTDPFYKQTDFSLDLFLALKSWHEQLVSNPNYGDLLDVFGSNLLPPAGSRPTKRAVQPGNERRGPSKIRAIANNGILQQMGFLANVISGMGTAATVDIEEFGDVFRQSPRLQQCLGQVMKAKKLGSVNTVLAYCRMVDAGFWVNRAYHGSQPRNQRASRRVGQHLRKNQRYLDIQQVAWSLRDDLIDLYRLVDRLDIDSARITGSSRVDLDLLHAIRIALIIDSLMLICRAPVLGEANQYSHEDMLAFGLSLDFDRVLSILDDAFGAMRDQPLTGALDEAENYSSESKSNFEIITREIMQPLRDNQALIIRISAMVSAHYGAHG
ncbi:MAG: phosphoenolpyruvate carboxylase [Bacteroidetes bacterium]|nr:phosphoenolpyruvate carboxylase [Bacteroidota bacterium]